MGVALVDEGREVVQGENRKAAEKELQKVAANLVQEEGKGFVYLSPQLYGPYPTEQDANEKPELFCII